MTATPILLKPSARLFTAAPYQEPTPPPAPTLRRVLYVKFLRWIEQSSSRTLLKAFCRVLVALCVAAAVFVPQMALGALYGALQWHQYGIVKFAAVMAAITYATTAIRWIRRRRVVKDARGNAHTFEGIGIDSLATFLMERKAFKRDDAMHAFAITQQKHQRISELLEKHGVLIRGENNARVLNEITREQLVRQLRDKFPLQFHNGEWCERTDGFQRYIMDRDRVEATETAKADRLQRKVKRMEKKRAALAGSMTAFQQIVRPVMPQS